MDTATGRRSAIGETRSDLIGVQQMLVGVLRSVADGRAATYVSVPINTGPRFLSWRRANTELTPGSSSYRSRHLKDVIEPNRRDARPLVDRARQHFGGVVIDPTKLDDVPGWEQLDYHRFWVQIIEELAARVVVADGWPYSSGCAFEVAAALRLDVPVLDSKFRSVERDAVSMRLSEAIADMSTANLATDTLETVLAEILAH